MTGPATEVGTNRRLLSLVVPVYYNAINLPETIPELLALAEPLAELDLDLELVLVDDGSGDHSAEIIREFQRQHPHRITAVILTRNFGSMAAIEAGLSIAAGNCVAMIAADLQDPPAMLIDMARFWVAGTKAIFAVRQDREESALQRFAANRYYSLLRRFALPGYPRGGFDFFLIDRQLVHHLLTIREKNTNLMSLIFWLGYRPIQIPYIRKQRRKGVSRWTLAKKIKLVIDSFVAFSYVPIRVLSATGLLAAVSAFSYGAVVLLLWLTQGVPVRGFTPLIIAVVFAAGLQMVMLGVLGEYLWRTLDESRRRPSYVIDEIQSRRSGSSDAVPPSVS